MTAASACPQTLQRISSYLDGELDAGACDEVERHCLDCAACASVVEGLRRTVGICREAGAAPLPEAVRQRARDRVDAIVAPANLTPSVGNRRNSSSTGVAAPLQLSAA